MSDPSLQQLEREVEAARARLVTDLSVLRSPASFSEFKEELKHEALDAKDALMEKAQSTVQSTVEGIIEDIKGRAAANPAAVLAIGAGIAWRLIRHPPIATALIGTGLYSLFRTTPLHNGSGRQVDYLAQAKQRLGEQASDVALAAKDQVMDVADTVKERALEMAGTVRAQAGELAEGAQQKAQQWRDDAREAVGYATAEVQDRAASAANRTSAALGDARQIAEDAVTRAAASARRQSGRFTEDARNTGADLAARASMTADRASSSIQQAFNDQDLRDKVLLGVAGLAVATALGMAYQRRQNED